MARIRAFAGRMASNVIPCPERTGILIETQKSKLPGGDIAGEEFWEEWWKRTRLPLPLLLTPSALA